MASDHETKSAPRSLLSALLAYFSQDWVTLCFDLYRAIRLWVNHQRREGMYEILDYDVTLELKDRKGEMAIFKNQQRVKFLQDEIISFPDYAWGDGSIFADYHCSPGRVVDRYQEGDRWNILISLRETKNSGDTEDFYIERIAKRGFLKAEESLQTEIRHRTRRLRMTIIFPKGRQCQRAVLLKRSRHRTQVLGPEHFTNLPNGEQRLVWETTKIRRFEIFTIKWMW